MLSLCLPVSDNSHFGVSHLLIKQPLERRAQGQILAVFLAARIWPQTFKFVVLFLQEYTYSLALCACQSFENHIKLCEARQGRRLLGTLHASSRTRSVAIPLGSGLKAFGPLGLFSVVGPPNHFFSASRFWGHFSQPVSIVFLEVYKLINASGAACGSLSTPGT